MKEVIAAVDLEAHERGEFDGAELIARLHSLTPGVDRMQVKRGWHAIQHAGPAQTLQALRELGVDC